MLWYVIWLQLWLHNVRYDCVSARWDVVHFHCRGLLLVDSTRICAGFFLIVSWALNVQMGLSRLNGHVEVPPSSMSIGCSIIDHPCWGSFILRPPHVHPCPKIGRQWILDDFGIVGCVFGKSKWRFFIHGQRGNQSSWRRWGLDLVDITRTSSWKNTS